jgi:hypothetical protein
MALKITSEIGTDQGITSEAYVRIVNYNINKTGSANFALQIFNSEAEATALSAGSPLVGSFQNGIAKNVQIGDNFSIGLTKEVTETITVQRSIPTEVEVTEEVIVPGVDSSESTIETITKTVIQSVLTDVQEERVVVVPDLSSLAEVDIFTFAYGKLKEKLEAAFGEGNVIDC